LIGSTIGRRFFRKLTLITVAAKGDPLDPRTLSGEHQFQDIHGIPKVASRDPHAALEQPELARAFRHYIDHLASWYDLNDSQTTFSTIVPESALINRILFNAIIAFATIHLEKTTGDLRGYGPVFHAACVERLLRLTEFIEPGVREEYLAATCLLRSYEILIGEMVHKEQHLLGAYSFALNSSIDLNHRGLAQAGAWNYLREEITVALQQQRPVRIGMSINVEDFIGRPDDMQANAITYILAEAINLRFGTVSPDEERLIDRKARYSVVADQLDAWRRNLPASFEPYSMATKPGNAFPSLWMLRQWHGELLEGTSSWISLTTGV
jgi:Fungal specific transcription factor domain